MKFSGLVPIRSTNEAYTPFSGLRKRTQHKRAQSEIPPATTSVMGIQCDSRELLECYARNESAQGSRVLTKTQVSSPFTNPALSRICKVEPQIFEMESFVDLENEGNAGRKIEFGKTGDWNERYVLKSKNHLNFRVYSKKVATNKVDLKKVCKIVEFSTNVFSDVKKRKVDLSVWKFNSGDKGIFSSRDTMRLQKRMNVLNTKY